MMKGLCTLKNSAIEHKKSIYISRKILEKGNNLWFSLGKLLREVTRGLLGNSSSLLLKKTPILQLREKNVTTQFSLEFELNAFICLHDILDYLRWQNIKEHEYM